jgi:hypothetical protein
MIAARRTPSAALSNSPLAQLQPLTPLYRDISSNYREVLTEEVSHDVVRMRQRRR